MKLSMKMLSMGIVLLGLPQAWSAQMSGCGHERGVSGIEDGANNRAVAEIAGILFQSSSPCSPIHFPEPESRSLQKIIFDRSWRELQREYETAQAFLKSA